MDKVKNHSAGKFLVTFAKYLPITLVLIWLLSSIATVFVEPFRTDESFFIYISKVGEQAGAPFELRNYLLSSWFKFEPDLESSTLALRAFAISQYIFLTIIIFFISKKTMNFTQGKFTYLHLSFSIALASWFAIHRGFEVRGELIANNLILAATLLCLASKEYSIAALRFWISLLLLFFATLFGFRYWLLCFAIFFSLSFLAGKPSGKSKTGIRWAIYISLAFVVVTTAINYVFFDLLHSITTANAWKSSNDIKISALQKLFFDRSGWGLQAQRAYYGIVVLALLCAAVRIVKARQYTSLLPVFAPVISFYIFFFLFDAKPFLYVRTIEATSFICSMAIFFFKFRPQTIQLNEVQTHLGAFIFTSFVACLAFHELSPRYDFRNSFFVDIQSWPTNTDMVDIANPESLISQVAVRVNFCKIYGDTEILVASPLNHPFCGRDVGSKFNAGFQNFPEELKLLGLKSAKGNIIISKEFKEISKDFGFSCKAIQKPLHLCSR